MANIIHAVPSQLIRAAGVFETTAGEIKNLTSNMTAIVQQLTGRTWSGEAASAYTNKFQSLQGDINRLYSMIHKHSDQLTQIAREFERTETENTSQSGSLSGSILS